MRKQKRESGKEDRVDRKEEIMKSKVKNENMKEKMGNREDQSKRGSCKEKREEGWRGKHYATKQIEAYAVKEGEDWLVISVVVRYF